MYDFSRSEADDYLRSQKQLAFVNGSSDTFASYYLDGDYYNRSDYPPNWAGDSSFRDRRGFWHSEQYYDIPDGRLCITDGHISDLWVKGVRVAHHDFHLL